MRFDTSQHMKLGQSMKLAPRMIQSMEVLQMSLTELEERIEQELENNATLERVEGDAQAGIMDGNDAVHADEPRGSEAEDFERLDDFSDANPDAAANEFEGNQEHEAPAASSDSWERNSWEPELGPRQRNDGERDAKMDAMAAAPARSASLIDQLQGQWGLADVKLEFRADGELLISFLDDDGYLRTPLETIIDRAPNDRARPTVEHLERALQAVQLFLEPAGTAARNARECLLLQISALEDNLDELSASARDHAREGTRDARDRDVATHSKENTAQERVANERAEHDQVSLDKEREILPRVRTLIESHLDDLMQNRLPKVAEKTGFTLEEIKAALLRMRTLSLAPARRLVNDVPNAITPDAIIEYDADADRYIAYLNDRRLPLLRVNQEYALMAKDRAVPKPDREFLKTNIGNAQWLIDAVQQRQNTLLRVIKVVVAAQREYFDFGPQALKPLPMTQVAEQLGIHVATVSRAVAEKYVQTPRGVVPLRKFFSGGTQTDTGEDVSWDAIKAALRDVIEAEDKAKPLSDEALVEELKARGIEIARRTVAKYRDQLGIPSARLRKAF